MIYEYDGTDEKCPVPLVQMRLLLKKMNQGDQCTILVTDSGSKQDIPKLLRKQGYQYTEMINADIVKIVIST